MPHVEQELLSLPEHLTSQKFLQTIVGLSILLIILLSMIRFTISDFPLYYLQNFVRKRNIVRNKLRDSLFSQIIANRSENTVTVSQKTGKGNMKGQSAYFKVFVRPCFTGNSRKYNLPYNQNREINRNTNPNNIANI
jgi:hypothetical protein